MRFLKVMKAGARIVVGSCLISLETLRLGLLMKQVYEVERTRMRTDVDLDTYEPFIIMQVFLII